MQRLEAASSAQVSCGGVSCTLGTNASTAGRSSELKLIKLQSETIAIAKVLRPIEKKAAKKRQKEHGNTAPGKKKQNTSADSAGVKESRNAVAAYVGMGRDTLGKAESVVDAAAENPEKYGKLRKEDAKKNTQKRVGELLGVTQQSVSKWWDSGKGNNTTGCSISSPDARIKINPKLKPVIVAELTPIGVNHRSRPRASENEAEHWW